MERLWRLGIQISSNSVTYSSFLATLYIPFDPLYPTSLNELVYDISLTFGMHAAISKQRFLYPRSILRRHFVTSRLKYPCYGFSALHVSKTFENRKYERNKNTR